jgi:SulP family sulfate permease
MLVILAALSPLVARVAVATLAAVLIFAAAGALRASEVRTIMRTGRISQIAVTSTFLANLFLPAAVGIGVALSLLLQLNRGAMDLSVVELVPAGHGRSPNVPRQPHCPATRSPSWTSTAACCMPGCAPCRPGCATPPDPTRQ